MFVVREDSDVGNEELASVRRRQHQKTHKHGIPIITLSREHMLEDVLQRMRELEL